MWIIWIMWIIWKMWLMCLSMEVNYVDNMDNVLKYGGELWIAAMLVTLDHREGHVP